MRDSTRYTVLASVAALMLATLSAAAFANGGPTTGWKRFTSTRYGYSVLYPPGWTTVRATTSVLVGSSFPLEVGPEVDKLLSCGDSCPKGIDVVVYARKLSPGTTLSTFAADEASALQEQSRSTLKSRTKATLAGEPAIVLTCSRCLDNYLIEFAVVHHGHGFDVYMLAPPGHEARDRSTFLHILTTFRFTH